MKLFDPVAYAIPGFVILMLVEILYARWRGRDDYELRDSACSLAMGFGNLGAGLATAGIVYWSSVWVYQYRWFTLGYTWWSYLLLFLAEDLCYYWFHRLSHEHRFWWAAHVNHHSSQHYNLSTALRQTWTGGISLTWIMWLPLSLIGFPPPLIAFQKGISLVYQFWIHTEAIRRLPVWIEAIWNTPSHHRVHHATNPRYLDANYAGILIIWDKMFGSFVPEDDAEPCRYGLVRNLGSFNPLKVAFHEWWAIVKDVRQASSLRAALGYIFGPPGWSPDGSRQTSAQIRAAWVAAGGTTAESGENRSPS